MNDTTESLTQIYDFKNNDERFLIKNHESLSVNIKYLDEAAPAHMDASISGGAARKSKKTKKMTGAKSTESESSSSEESIYSSLAAAACKYKQIDAFIKTCHIYSVAALSRSNSIFIIPNAEGMKAIEADIKKALGNVKPDSEDGVRLIQTSKLLYKQFILDSYGSEENNATFEYRIPMKYPEDFNSDVIYRRTSRYGDVYFLQLEKDKCKISLNSDMSNSITCKYINKFGPIPLAFAFEGNILALHDKKQTMNGGAAKKGKARKTLKRMLNSMDSEKAAFNFVGNAIASFGVEKCLPYYSSSMIQSAFAIASAFGDEMMNLDSNVSAAHSSILKSYKPKQRRSLNKTNIDKLRSYGASFLEKFEDCSFGKSTTLNSSTYFKQLKSAYKQIASDIKNESIIENQIAGDIAYGVYDETNNAELAFDMIEGAKSALSGKRMSSLMLGSVVDYLEGGAFKGLNAQQYYPMLNLESEVSEIKGGEVSDEIDDLEFGSEPVADEE